MEVYEERRIPIEVLREFGLTDEELENYVQLEEQGHSTCEQRIRMLTMARKKTLDEIHLKEKQIERMDYLRHEMRRQAEGVK